MNKITVELTEDQAREVIEALDERITLEWPKGFMRGKATPSKDPINAFRIRIISKLKVELAKDTFMAVDFGYSDKQS